MQLTIAEKYKMELEALPAHKQSEMLRGRPEFAADISYTPGPCREKILTFHVDGSVFEYDTHWALSRTEWADRDKSICGF